jgi:hypothetical protein
MSTRQVFDAATQAVNQRDAMLAACKSARDLIAQGRAVDAERVLNRVIADTVAHPIRIEPPVELTLVDDGPDNDHWRRAG